MKHERAPKSKTLDLSSIEFWSPLYARQLADRYGVENNDEFREVLRDFIREELENVGLDDIIPEDTAAEFERRLNEAGLLSQ